MSAAPKYGFRAHGGMSLMELLIAMALGVILLLTVVTMFSSARQTYRLQGGLARVQEDGRVAMLLISEQVRLAGYRSPVWKNPRLGFWPLTSGSVNGADGASDTLQLMYMDSEDCTGTLNSLVDPETGEARADYKQITFSVDDIGNLQMTCEYGLDPVDLQVQISDQVIVDGVESFQILYGLDTDLPPDFSINAWASADKFDPKASVCLQSQYLCERGNLLGSIGKGVPSAIKVALLLSSPDVAGAETENELITVLDVAVTPPNDQRVRKIFTTTIALRNLTI